MKRRYIIFIIALIMAAALTACKNGKEKINEPTVEPTVTIAPVITPTAEPATSEVSTSSPEPMNTVEPTEVVDNNTPILMDTPPFSYYIAADVQKKEVQPLELNRRSSKPNNITDDAYWFSSNDLSLNTYQVPNPYQNMAGNLPSEIDTTWNDLFITSAFYDDSYIYCTYGPNFAEGYILKIYDARSLKTAYFMDFTNYNHLPDLLNYGGYMQQQINWAIIQDNILYFSIGHNMNGKYEGYVTAINLSNLSIVWRTDPLVSNSNNFLIIDDVIISGYGYSDEPDFLYQINKITGEIIDKIKLKTMASYIIYKDHALFVRTYNTDYVFDIVPMKD